MINQLRNQSAVTVGAGAATTAVAGSNDQPQQETATVAATGGTSSSSTRDRKRYHSYPDYVHPLFADGTPVDTSPEHKRLMQTMIPENLRALSRKTWPSHPNMASQGYIVDFHRSFRNTSAQIVATLNAGGNPSSSSLKSVRRMFERWMQHMDTHEWVEENRVYPHLTALYGVSMASLVEEHRDMHVARARVLGAFKAVERLDGDKGDKGVSAWEELVASVVAFDRLLSVHLMEEEDIVVPMLISLTPKEFHSMI